MNCTSLLAYFAFAMLCFSCFSCLAQAEKGSTEDQPYVSKHVKVPDADLQYMDFGGRGLTIMLVQDFHNYFELQEEEDAVSYIAWMSDLSRNYRVLANVRRGWGESSTSKPGFQVPVHAEDMLAIMDAEGIEKAVFMGRTSATQEMVWLAEHHPERVAGLIFSGVPMVPVPSGLQPEMAPEVIEFWEKATRASCDTNDKSLERGSWHAHFMNDENFQLEVPVLQFYSPTWDRNMKFRELQNFKRDKERWASADFCGDVSAQEYFKTLSKDSARIASLIEMARPIEMEYTIILDRMKKALGDNLMLVNEDEELEPIEDYYKAYLPFINDFTEKLTD